MHVVGQCCLLAMLRLSLPACMFQPDEQGVFQQIIKCQQYLFHIDEVAGYQLP